MFDVLFSYPTSIYTWIGVGIILFSALAIMLVHGADDRDE